MSQVLWSTISQVLIQGIVNLRRMRPRQSSSGRSATPGAHLPGEMVVTSALDCVQMTLEALSGTSPLLGGSHLDHLTFVVTNFSS